MSDNIASYEHVDSARVVPPVPPFCSPSGNISDGRRLNTQCVANK